MTRSIVVRGAAASVLALAALGGTLALTAGSSSAASKPQIVKLSAVPGQLKFNTKTLKAKAGLIEIEMTNPSNSGIPHGIAVQGHGQGKPYPDNPGHTATLSVTLKKGTYTFFCPVPGHEAAGMKGTLVVS